ncbi:MAG: hypothetical protein JST08_10040 [Actinobacteria bacterium]|nr:hypothetical protein [Actinomycetota bacterium]
MKDEKTGKDLVSIGFIVDSTTPTRPPPPEVDVIVNYTNCVQCGAITAKGGRLTPPEGGDGPLYQNT